MKTIQEPVATILLLTHDWLVMMPMLLTSQHNGTVIYTKLALRYVMFRYTNRCLSIPLLVALLPSLCNSTTMAVVSQHKPGVKRMVTVWRSRLARLLKGVSRFSRHPSNQSTSFLTLPTEIRYEIYDYIFLIIRPRLIMSLDRKSEILPDALKTAASTEHVRREIRAYYFAKHEVLLNALDIQFYLSGIRTDDGGHIFPQNDILNSVTILRVRIDLMKLLDETAYPPSTMLNAVEGVLSCPNLKSITFEFEVDPAVPRRYSYFRRVDRSPLLCDLLEDLHYIVEPVALRSGVTFVMLVPPYAWCYRGRHVMEDLGGAIPKFEYTQISLLEWLWPYPWCRISVSAACEGRGWGGGCGRVCECRG